MPSSPDDPVIAAKNKSRSPKILDADHIDNTFNPHTSAVPRYIRPSTYGSSPNSRHSNACHETPNYELLSINLPTYRRGDLYSSDKKSSPIETPTRSLTTGTGMLVPTPGAPVTSLARPTAKLNLGKARADETFQETWEVLVSLLGCFEIDPTPSVSPSSLLNSSTGLKQQATGNSTSPGYSETSPTAPPKQADRHQRSNNNGRGLPPDGDDNRSWDRQGGNGPDDLQLTEGRNVSSHKLFACPFHKSDPVRYASCHGASFKDIDSVLRVSLTHTYCETHVIIVHLRGVLSLTASYSWTPL
jgi:hypothetical protein